MCDPKEVCVICKSTQQECFTQTLDKNKQNMLKVVIPQPKEQEKSGQSQQICVDCDKDLQFLFDFKSKCLENENFLLSNKEHNEKINLMDVTQKASYDNGTDEDCIDEICRLCMKGTKLQTSNTLDIVRDILTKCIPEMDMALTTKTVFCKICVGSLEKHSEFLSTYLGTHNRKSTDKSASSSSFHDDSSDETYEEDVEMEEKDSLEDSDFSQNSDDENSRSQRNEDNPIASCSNQGTENRSVTLKNPNSFCNCIVCQIVDRGFPTFSFKQQLAIHRQGRPQPSLKRLVQNRGNSKRHFNAQTYRNVSWLTGCDTLLRVFCWPCVLFSELSKEQHSGWVKSGYMNLQNIHEGIKKHARSVNHLRAMTKDRFFKKMWSKNKIAIEENSEAHNDVVKQNRAALKKLVDIVCYLVKNEDSFEDSASFLTFFDLLVKYDDSIDSNWLQDADSSNFVYDNVIKALGSVAASHIKKEIRKTNCVSIILVNNATNESQVAVIVRYIKDKDIREHTLGFLDVSADKTTEELFQQIAEIIYDLGAKSKLISYSFIGATVKSDKLKKLQTKLNETFKNARFVHFWEYKLDILLAQSLMHIPKCKVFFSTLKGIGEFFLKSKRRAEVFYKAIGKGSATELLKEWEFGGSLVKTVRGYRDCLIGFFEFVLNSPEIWDVETLKASQGYLSTLRTDRDFNFFLNNLSEVFTYAVELQQKMQDTVFDTPSRIREFHEFIDHLDDNKVDFEPVWGNFNPCETPQRKRSRTENGESDTNGIYKNIFVRIIDTLKEEMEVRFQNLKKLKYFKLIDFSQFQKIPIPVGVMASLNDQYEHFFDGATLRSELSVIFSTEQITKKKDPLELLAFIKDEGFEEVFVETYKFCEFLLTVPAVKCSNPAFRRIKNRCKNSKAGDIWPELSVLCIEKELLSELCVRPTFFDDFICEFAKSDSNMKVKYK